MQATQARKVEAERRVSEHNQYVDAYRARKKKLTIKIEKTNDVEALKTPGDTRRTRKLPKNQSSKKKQDNRQKLALLKKLITGGLLSTRRR